MCDSFLEDLERRMADLGAAAVDCCPDTWAARRIANEDRPMYVEQLHYIESEEKDILKAIREYARSNASRTEWYQKGYVKESDVEKYESKFIAQHKLIFGRPIEEGVSDAERGQETLRQCKLQGISNQLDNRQPYAEFPEGTLHKLSNSRVIGWHPNWEQRFGKVDDHDRA